MGDEKVGRIEFGPCPEPHVHKTERYTVRSLGIDKNFEHHTERVLIGISECPNCLQRESALRAARARIERLREEINGCCPCDDPVFVDQAPCIEGGCACWAPTRPLPPCKWKGHQLAADLETK